MWRNVYISISNGVKLSPKLQLLKSSCPFCLFCGSSHMSPSLVLVTHFFFFIETLLLGIKIIENKFHFLRLTEIKL